MAGQLLIFAGEKMTFQEVDKTSFELFEKQEWKPLKKFVKEAVKDGFDYYFLRMRGGIACFKLEQYIDAADNFEKAMSFNSDDPVAEEYLFYCWLNLNKTKKAIAVFKKMPPSYQEKLKKMVPKEHQFSITGGPILSNQPEKFGQLDIDGDSDIYGEAAITDNGYYFNADFSWQFNKGFAVSTSYSLVSLNKTQIIQIGNTEAINNPSTLTQQQFYLSGKIPLGKNFTIVPAFNTIHLQYEMVVAEFNKNTLRYRFPTESFQSNSFIGFLAINKDFKVIQTGFFGAYSNLNAKKQYQAGLKLVLFPLQNLNFYLSSTLLNHNNDGQDNLIFEQMIGGRDIETGLGRI